MFSENIDKIESSDQIFIGDDIASHFDEKLNFDIFIYCISLMALKDKKISI